jgi:hypothetical protein
MVLDAGPGTLGGCRGVGEISRSWISNFAATLIPMVGSLSPIDDATSEIIDAILNANYAFLDVPVEIGIGCSSDAGTRK